MTDVIDDEEARVARARANPYTVHEDYSDYGSDEEAIICPYCLYEDHEPGEHFTSSSDGDEKEFQCPECDQVSMAKLHVSYSYSCSPIDPTEPRSSFLATVVFDEKSYGLHVAPWLSASELIIRVLMACGRDPLAQGPDHVGEFQVIDSGGVVLRGYQKLVKQGVRHQHTLTIQRKIIP